MKKTLAAVAVLGAFAGSAMAANVSLYGSVSTGLLLQHSKSVTEVNDNGDEVNVARTNKFGMESAWYGDSIWGLTGEEELGNGWKVGFTLENECGSDDGSLAGGEDNKLFDSQAYLKLTNDTFTVAAGRFGGLDSAGGDFDLVGGFDPLEAAFGVGGMGTFYSRDYTYDNAVVFSVAPVDGLTVSAMASFGDDSNAGWSQRNHYYALGALYENGPLSVGLTGSWLKYQNVTAKGDNDGDDPVAVNAKDGYTVTFGTSWDFDFVKPMFMYQHADKVRGFQDEDDVDAGSNAYAKIDSFLLGATAPLGDGTLMASAQYMKAKLYDAETKESVKGDAWVLGVAYNYELSKRTSVYVGATYAWGDDGLDTKLNDNSQYFDTEMRQTFNGFQFGIGLNHTF